MNINLEISLDKFSDEIHLEISSEKTGIDYYSFDDDSNGKDFMAYMIGQKVREIINEND